MPTQANSCIYLVDTPFFYLKNSAYESDVLPQISAITNNINAYPGRTFAGWGRYGDNSSPTEQPGAITYDGAAYVARWTQPEEETLLISNTSLIDLGDAVRTTFPSVRNQTLSISDMVSAISPTKTQLKRLSWSRTGSVYIGKKSSKSFAFSAMNKNKKYPFVFFTKVIYGSGYPPHSVFVIYDGNENTYTYSYTYVDFKGSVEFNDNNAVLTLRNNTNTSYEMRFTNTVNPAGDSEEYVELFYFPPVE